MYVNGKRVDNPATYLPYPHALSPPGDCVIITFDESIAEETDVLCESWQAANWDYNSFERPVVVIGDVAWQ